MVITASVPLSDRAATPAARRITSAGHSSRSLPSPTASTLATGSDGATTRGDLVGAALGAERLERDLDLADGLRVEERVGDDGRGRVLVLPADHGHDQHRRNRFLRLGSDEATVTVGAWYPAICGAHERSA